jgi:N-ethylmaleimide reductase
MSLFDKVKIGSLLLKNRIVLSAMTRLRADPKTGLANDLHKEYYSQRSGAGLLFTEASAISQRGHSWPGSANIMNQEQADAWKPVVEAVKKKGGNIYIQHYHGGRNCHKVINGGLETWGPSPVAIRGKVHGTDLPYDKPH